MSDHAIEMEDIAKDFGAVRALKGVTLRVRGGSIHALVGANGAGKSTLMKILDGVYPAGSYRGEIRIAGARAALRSPHDARRKGIGYVPQEISVIEPLSVAENIFVGQTGRGGHFWTSRRELEGRARRFLEEQRISLEAGAPASYLSASERQLVMIARALAGRPKVLILDEATACLTDREAGSLFELLRHLKKQGLTCIFVSHRLREVEELADRVTVLRDGEVAAAFDRGGYGQEAVVSAMVGPMAAQRLEGAVAKNEIAADRAEVLRVERLFVPHPRLAHRHVVEEASFALRRGEILGLAGLVGSGRSALLNALAGRIPFRGGIFLEGRQIRLRSPQEAHRLGIGLLTEDRKGDGLLFNLGLRENISAGALSRISRFGFLDRRAETRFAEEFSRRFDLRAPSAAAPVGALSGGNQQKVILARLLLARPRVLLLDEPTKGVDVAAREEIYRTFRELASEGVAMVLVSSEFEELLWLCDRIVVLARGHIIDRMDRGEASEARIVRAATGGENPSDFISS
ncbi:MAG: sugar ABC transporter ATP-binding protein [Planctomycetes bacterium]|nr:sugar ABC transporter ATP-binding protein [Planctomycetota bacterium]